MNILKAYTGRIGCMHITDDIIRNFCDYYIEQGDGVFFNASDLANAVADAFGEMSCEDFARLVTRCEAVLKTRESV